MLEYFNELSKEEVNKFKKFVNSPYFNSYKTVIKLFDYLKSLYPGIRKEDISNKQISLIVYNQKNRNSIKVRKLISDFTNIFERFLLQISIEKHDSDTNLKLLKELRERRIHRRHKIQYKKFRKINSNIIFKDEYYYWNEFQFEYENFFKDFSENVLFNTEILKAQSDNIDLLFMYSKIVLFVQMEGIINYNKKATKFEISFINEIITYISENENAISKYHPFLYMEYLYHLLFKYKTENYEKKLVDYYNSFKNKLNENFSYVYYIKIVDYYRTMLYQENKQEFNLKLYNFYKWIIKNHQSFILNNGSILEHLFFSILSQGIIFKNLKWSLNFIDKFGKHLDPAIKTDANNLAKALVFFETKEYSKSLSYLENISFKKSYYYLESKILLSKIYYEENNLDSVVYILDTLRKYFKNTNKNLFDMGESRKKFLYYLSRLINARKKPLIAEEKTALEILKTELKKDKSDMYEKKWLYKILEIKK